MDLSEVCRFGFLREVEVCSDPGGGPDTPKAFASEQVL